MATTGSSPSAGAVTGARTAYDMHSVNNQENPSTRKYGNSTGVVRQRSTSNLRTPLSTTPSLRKSPNEAPRSGTQRNGDTETRTKNGLEVTKAQDLYKKDSNDDLQYDDIPENMYRPDKEDLAGWIHREKLAKIENEELQAAGINLAKARSKSKDALSGRGRETPKDHRDHGSVARDERKVRTSSPVNEDPEEIGQADWDFRTPEEIANDNAASQMYTTPLLRKSGSKIPVMTSSPTPIPSDRYERETPMPRKRTMSGSITPEDSLSIARTKPSHEAEVGQSGSKFGTPTKRSKSVGSRQASISTEYKQVPGSRKPSISSTKPGQTPASQSNRPATRGNDTDRPRTAVNPPDGDPPWLATMYKPDPRLPPDQQLIPTLAKKQQQQMWEAQGQVPSTYDRNFAPLQIYDADGQPRPVNTEPETVREKLEDSESWPLKSTPLPKPSTSPQKPSTNSGTGGYSTMPKVTDPPVPVASAAKIRTSSPAPVRAQTPQGTQASNAQTTQGTTTAPSRLQQQPLSAEQEKKVQKKGCCCIVM